MRDGTGRFSTPQLGAPPRRWSGARGVARAAVALACAVGVCGSAVAAEPTWADRQTARKLIAEAEQLLESGKADAALEQFEKAARIVDAPSIWLAIAHVRAKLGRFVDAMDAYARARDFRLRADSPPPFKKAVAQATSEMEELRLRMPTIEVRVTGADPTEVKLGDRVLRPDQIGRPVEVDPGRYHVTARAPGRRAAETDREVKEGEQAVVRLKLEVASPKAPAGARGATPAERDPTSAGGPGPWPWIALGVGAVGVGVGTWTGLETKSRARTLREHCGATGKECPESDGKLIDEGRRLGTISTVSFVVAGAAITTGVVLLATRKRQEPTAAATAARGGGGGGVEAWVGPWSAGVRGNF